ncbi:hypothetical protein [Flavobacterium subsaxonicum]|uniref:hypothetical protein n=1 Tax=Flavobacterium subsaxonicum TaxID=426226 RepID=UPI00103AD30F|nr:hypothetical protein [Flavobacterium subsaxonicum]
MQTIPKNRGIRKGDGKAARCTGSEKTAGNISAGAAPADGFLRQQFFPLYESTGKVPKRGKAETAFFESLEILTGVYGFTITGIEDKPYPLNILYAHHQVEKQLTASGQDIEVSIVKDNGAVKLMTCCQYATGTTLYYIPVLPLYKLIKERKHRHTAALLLSVCCYLYRNVCVPFYRDDYCFIYYNYECMEGWFDEDMEGYADRHTDITFKELRQAKHYGDIMHRKIYNPYHLADFQRRIAAYTPNTAMEYECLSVAKRTFALMQDYPERSIFKNTRNQEFEEGEDSIAAEQYISFVARTDGALYDQIAQMVNDEFNECGEMQIPTLTQLFDAENTPDPQGLDFEYRLFPLINDLCSILNNLP